MAGALTLAPAAALVMATGTMVTLAGCEKPKPPPPPPPPPPQPVAPPAPEPVTVSKVLSDLKPDPRVQFPQEAAPVDESLAKAVVTLANAIVKGESDAVRALLSGDAQVTLDGLVNSGEWDDATSKIEGVRVLRIRDNAPSGTQAMSDATVWIAVQEPGSAYVMGWNAINAAGGGWKFDGAPATNATRPRAQDFASMGESDLIAQVAAGAVQSASRRSGTDELAGQMEQIAAQMGQGLQDMAKQLSASASEADLALVYLSSEVVKKIGTWGPEQQAAAGLMADAMTRGKAAIDKKVAIEPAKFKAVVDGLKIQTGKSQDEVIGACAQVMGIDNAAATSLYEGKAPAPVVAITDAPIRGGGTRSSMNIYVQYQIYMLEMGAKSKDGKPLPAEADRAFARKFELDPITFGKEMEVGAQDTHSRTMLPKADEFRKMVDEIVERSKANRIETYEEDVFAHIRHMTGISEDALIERYDAGAPAKEEEKGGLRLRFRKRR